MDEKTRGVDVDNELLARHPRHTPSDPDMLKKRGPLARREVDAQNRKSSTLPPRGWRRSCFTHALKLFGVSIACRSCSSSLLIC